MREPGPDSIWPISGWPWQTADTRTIPPKRRSRTPIGTRGTFRNLVPTKNEARRSIGRRDAQSGRTGASVAQGCSIRSRSRPSTFSLACSCLFLSVESAAPTCFIAMIDSARLIVASSSRILANSALSSDTDYLCFVAPGARRSGERLFRVGCGHADDTTGTIASVPHDTQAPNQPAVICAQASEFHAKCAPRAEARKSPMPST